jgi:magnesium chelatase family protein
MEAARARTAAIIGVKGHLVEVEACITPGLPATILTGLPDTVLREARDRVRAAIVNSGERWPSAKITVGLSPAMLPKRGSAYDLAIAIAVMAANGDLPAPPEGTMFLAELGLDGRLRPAPCVLPAALAATDAEITTLVVATANQAEAGQVPGLTVIAADTLTEVANWLRGGPPPHLEPPGPGSGDGPVPPQPQPDLADVLGQAEARRALEVCAAGGHHLSLLGPSGTGKTMLAERLPSILPPLDTAGALEVASIRSVAGMPAPGTGLVTTPPFVTPHHTSSKAAMVGGGVRADPAGCCVARASRRPVPRPGAGVPPGRAGRAAPATRVGGGGDRPGIGASDVPRPVHPGPCGQPVPLHRDGSPAGGNGCRCSPAVRRRYLGRLSGPLLDRVSVKVSLQPVSREGLRIGRASGEPSAVVARRVATARERSASRLAGTPWRLNAEIPGSALHQAFPPAAGALKPLERAMELGQVSARGADHIVRMAWSLADLARKDQPGPDEINLAIELWLGAGSQQVRAATETAWQEAGCQANRSLAE